MKTEKNILIAFVLNIFFSIVELVGGLLTGSIAIMSDSIHDFGDALSIGISYFLEKKSTKKADKNHTYGYIRYSVMGSVITTTILLVGSVFVIYESMITPLLFPFFFEFNIIFIVSIFTHLNHFSQKSIIDSKYLSQINCLVIANSGAFNKDLGTIGIIGPKRMDYSKVISIMKYISKKLNEQ